MPTLTEPRLTDTQRHTLVDQLDADGYCVLPDRLPDDLVSDCLQAIDRLSAARRAAAAEGSPKTVKLHNCVDADPAFRRLMRYPPALQLAYDVFGPMFHLCQSNFISRPGERVQEKFITSSPWHADGPRPALFPRVGGKNGAMGLHYLKFGYFFTDLTAGNGGSLQVIRGSHKRPELDNRGPDFNVADYQKDLITFNCPAGTAVAFHQAQWHAAPPNQSAIERKNAYVSYCPTWMKPLDRELPAAGALPPDLTPEEAWLLGEHRTPLRFWLPAGDDATRMFRFKRDGDAAVIKTYNYD